MTKKNLVAICNTLEITTPKRANENVLIALVANNLSKLRAYFKRIEDRGFIMYGEAKEDFNGEVWVTGVICWEDIDNNIVYLWNYSDTNTDYDQFDEDYPSAGMSDEQLLMLFKSGGTKGPVRYGYMSEGQTVWTDSYFEALSYSSITDHDPFVDF
jgi:hypothetical protein